jgi:hypothetical protein
LITKDLGSAKDFCTYAMEILRQEKILRDHGGVAGGGERWDAGGADGASWSGGGRGVVGRACRWRRRQIRRPVSYAIDIAYWGLWRR